MSNRSQEGSPSGSPGRRAAIRFTTTLGSLIATVNGLLLVAQEILEQAPFDTARWIKGADPALKGFIDINKSNLARDRDGDPVFMARSAWDVSYQQERNPDLTFSATKER